MLVTGIVLGFLAGFLLGGSISNFIANSRRLRWLGLLALGAIVRFGTEIALNAGVPGVADVRLPLFTFAFGLLLAGCWANRSVVGFGLILAGTFANLVPILLNGGSMPIWAPALTAAGFTQADVHSAFHTIIYDAPGPAFLLRGGPLADIIPVPFPLIQNVISVGDLILAVGLSWFAFAAVLRHADESQEQHLEELLHGQLAGSLSGFTDVSGMAGAARLPRSVEATVRGSPIQAETGLTAGLAEASALERALVLGGRGVRLASPALAPLPTEFEPAPGVERRARPVGRTTRAGERAGVLGRISRHPYVRLALNGSFSALWVGQLISLLGDRVHQIAIAALILRLTDNSPIALGRRVHRGVDPEPHPRADRRHLRGPLGPPGDDGRQRPPAGRDGAAHPAGGRLERPVRLPAALPDHVRVAVLPAGEDRDHAPHRPLETTCSPPTRRPGSPRRSPTSAATRWRRCSWRSSARRCRSRSGSTRCRTSPRPSSSARWPCRDSAGGAGAAPKPGQTGRTRPQSRSRTSAGRCSRAGTSCATRRSCWRTRSRASSASSRSGATIAITALYATVSLDRGNVAAMAAYGFLETGVGVGNLDRRVRRGADRRPPGQGPDGHRRLHDLGDLRGGPGRSPARCRWRSACWPRPASRT